MTYRIRYSTAAVRELEKMSSEIAARIQAKVLRLRNYLTGDAKRLPNHKPEYRLRVGN